MAEMATPCAASDMSTMDGASETVSDAQKPTVEYASTVATNHRRIANSNSSQWIILAYSAKFPIKTWVWHMPETAGCLQQQPAPSIAQFATGQLD